VKKQSQAQPKAIDRGINDLMDSLAHKEQFMFVVLSLQFLYMLILGEYTLATVIFG
jgi:hypothetical protein